MISAIVSRFRLPSALCLSLLAMMSAVPAVADEPGADYFDLNLTDLKSLRLRDVMVTARKRPENLQHLPIAVSVIPGAVLADVGLDNLQELSASAPSFYIAESFIGDVMTVRGVGSGQNNLGFEQSVGLVIDGFYYGRSRFSRLPFVDPRRVEVIRGPQSTMFGKNATAGVINIVSQRPSPAREAWGWLGYELEEAEGPLLYTGASGALTDDVSARLALRADYRDGYFDNVATGRDDVEKEDLAGRLSLAWRPTDEFSLLTQLYHADLDHSGHNNQFSRCGANPVTQTLIAGTGEDCRANYRRSAVAPVAGRGNAESQRTEVDTLGVTAEWHLGEYSLTSLTGYAGYDYRDWLDSDRSSREAVLAELGEDYQQWSQELRLSARRENSGAGWTLGAYYQSDELDTDYILHFAQPGNASRNVLTREEGEVVSVFAQAGGYLSPAWHLGVGLRFSREEKDAHSTQFPSQLYSDSAPVSLPPAVQPANLAYTHAIRDSLVEENWSPAATLRWRPRENFMMYGSIRQGSKVGGFDHNLVAPQAEAIERFRFGDEEVVSFEVGSRWRLLEDSLELNTTVFHSEFHDLQLSGFADSAAAVNAVTNADEAISRGVEFDSRWLLSRKFSAIFSLVYLDAYYDDYANAPCYTGQSAASGCTGTTQDLGGQALPFAPDWNAMFGSEYVWDLPAGLSLKAFLKVFYTSEYALQADLDPRLMQGGNTKVDARLSLTGASQQWEVAVLGQNLTDKQTAFYGDDVPGQSGSYWRSIDAPRSVMLQLVYRFAAGETPAY